MNVIRYERRYTDINNNITAIIRLYIRSTGDISTRPTVLSPIIYIEYKYINKGNIAKAIYSVPFLYSLYAIPDRLPP